MNIKPPAEKLVLPGMKAKRAHDQSTGETQEQRSLNWINWMPKSVRAHFVAWLGEFVGTFMFLFFAFSATKVANQTTQAQTGGALASQAPNTSNLLYISLAFGFSLAVNAWVFFRITGGLFNPAVSRYSNLSNNSTDPCAGDLWNDVDRRCRMVSGMHHYYSPTHWSHGVRSCCPGPLPRRVECANRAIPYDFNRQGFVYRNVFDG